MSLRFGLTAAIFVGTAILLSAGERDDPKTDSYIKITAKGKLQTGVVAIGGETTGTVLTTKDGTLELDIKDKDARKRADALNGKTAIVTGYLAIKPGVKVKVRSIVTVESIKSDDEK